MTQNSRPADLENKSVSDDNVAQAFDGFMRAFEAFKETNDERLGQDRKPHV